MSVPTLVRMISWMFAREARAARRAAPRLRVDRLEERDVPATWNPVPVYDMYTNTTSFDTLASNPNNWTFGYGESIEYFGTATFNSSNTNPCDDFSGNFDAININPGYTGTITLNGHLTVTMLYQGDGTIDQPLGEDSEITVTEWWLWEGGSLNSTETPSRLTVDGTLYPGMTSGAIVPAITCTVTTGSTIQFVNGATGAVQPGEVVFNNDADFIVDDGCSVECQPTTGSVTFSLGNTIERGSRTWVKSGGRITVTGPDEWDGDRVPIQNNGTVYVRAEGTASFSGFTGPLGESASYRQTGAASKTVIESGSAISVADGMYLGAGKLATADPENGGTALIVGDVVNTGADITIHDPEFAPPGQAVHNFGRLRVNGDFRWSGGVFRPAIGWGGPFHFDTLVVEKKLIVSDGAKIGPIIYGTIPQQPARTWQICEADEIVIPVGNNPPVFDTAEQEDDMDLIKEEAAPVTWWRLEWTG